MQIYWYDVYYIVKFITYTLFYLSIHKKFLEGIYTPIHCILYHNLLHYHSLECIWQYRLWNKILDNWKCVRIVLHLLDNDS